MHRAQFAGALGGSREDRLGQQPQRVGHVAQRSGEIHLHLPGGEGERGGGRPDAHHQRNLIIDVLDVRPAGVARQVVVHVDVHGELTAHTHVGVPGQAGLDRFDHSDRSAAHCQPHAHRRVLPADHDLRHEAEAMRRTCEPTARLR